MKFKYKITKLNYFFSKKSNIIIFLLLLLGVLIPTLSGSSDTNLWKKLFSIISNPFFNSMYFISIGLNVIYMTSEHSKNYNIISRYKSYHNMVYDFINDIIVYTVYLAIISLILAISGAILLSFGNISMVSHPDYSIPLIIYIVIFFIRNTILSCLINIFLYLLFLRIGKYLTTLIVLLNSSLFFLLPNNGRIISRFYKLFLIPHYYYSYNAYSNLYVETICSILLIMIILTSLSIIIKIILKKKRDI